MLRVSARRLASVSQNGRRISASAVVREDDDRGAEAFLKKFMPKVSSTLAPPNFPTSYLKKPKEQEEGAGLPDKLTFNFFLPHTQYAKEQKVLILYRACVDPVSFGLPGATALPCLGKGRPVHSQ